MIFVFAATGILTIAIQYSGSKNKSSGECMMCHDDKDLFMEKNGKKISLFVNENHYKNSVHNIAECNDCHLNYIPDEIPHTPKPQTVNCLSCHDDTKSTVKGVHSELECYTCHTKHDIKPVAELKSNGKEDCLGCHKKKSVTQFVNSSHDRRGIKCSDCHQSGHNVKKVLKNEVLNTCGKCHSAARMSLSSSVHHSVLRAGGKNSPVCTDCHGSHKIFSSKFTIESEGCLKCHLNEKMFPGSETGSAKFVAEYKTSVHASIRKDGREAAGCIDCHGDHSIYPQDDPKSSTNRAKLIETCEKCHSEVTEKFKLSKHGKELLNNNVHAPSCVDCHGEHDIKSTLFSEDFTKINLVEKCLDCHSDGKIAHKNYKGEEELITGYRNSVHYLALVDGNTDAPTCSDCHGAHEMEIADDPSSKISKQNIAKTCGESGCHTDQLSEFMGSIHETGVAKGNNDSPTCNNCHGNHGIISKNIDGQLQKSRDLINLCSNCHASTEIVERNDLPLRVTETYKDSFHGLAVRGGSLRAANCESCHGYHNVRPSSDQLSTIYKDNLPHTCGNCHPGANEVLLTSKIHLTDLKQDSPWVYFVQTLYMVLIFGTIGFMIIHNVLDFKRKRSVRKKNKSGNDE
jgi:hypothetical protein